MTESVAEFRADLQRQFDAFDDVLQAHRTVIAETEREREMVALQIATIDRVMAMQPAPPAFPQTAAMNVGDTISWNGEQRVITHVLSAEQPAPPRTAQRADVRGPVLALIRNSASGLTLGEICALLPDLKPTSIRAALDAAHRRGEINARGGFYRKLDRLSASAPPTPEDAALGERGNIAELGMTPRDDRQDEDSNRHNNASELSFGREAALADSEYRRVPRHAEPEPDARSLTDTSPEAQATALRAAVFKAGRAGLPEENSWVAPAVIAAAIEDGWLSRTEHDKRLWLRDAEHGAGQ